MPNPPLTTRTLLRGGMLLTALLPLVDRPALGDPPGWRLLWSDDFQELDGDRWNVVTSNQPTNNSLHAYLPSQVAVENGRLVITSENLPANGLPYRSGQVISQASQQFGRWEVRAKLPTSTGMWPAIWLLPDVEQTKWPSGGEIDIMENRGNQPTRTSSAFHFGTNPPFRHHFVYHEQQMRVGGDLIDFSQDFHTYAVDWTDKHLRFYVDDVHYFTVFDEDVAGFLSSKTKPMQLVINTAVGGDFLPNPDASTVWPQKFEIDWVRVYEADPDSRSSTLVNGGFESGGGTLAGWSVFGDDLPDNPNVHAASEAVREGEAALKLFGTFGAGSQYAGVAQGIAVQPGQEVTASLEAYVRSADSIAGTDNTLSMKIEFYNQWGAKFDGDALLGFEELLVADGTTAPDAWHPHVLAAVAPLAAVEARLAIVFHQPGSAAGAVHVDQVEFSVSASAAAGDFNGDGIVDAADYVVWRDSLGSSGDGLAADGNRDGTVDQQDFALWREHFGQTISSPAQIATAVVEPATVVVAFLAAAIARVYGAM